MVLQAKLCAYHIVMQGMNLVKRDGGQSGLRVSLNFCRVFDQPGTGVGLLWC